MNLILELLGNPNAWMALITLTFLEIVLGIDNIVFISIASNKLEKSKRPRARNIGLFLAMIFRVILLFGISWILSLQKPIFHINFSWFNGSITGQSMIVFAGGVFLLYKSVSEIHHKLDDDEEYTKMNSSKMPSVINIIIQISLLNLVFSFDSILTAIGLISLEPVTQGGFGHNGGMLIMIIAVVISIAIMMAFAGPVSQFVNEHPTIQILGISFLILISVMLMAEASHLANIDFMGQKVHSIPKSYLYFAIFFSLLVEFINMKVRKKSSKPVSLRNTTIKDENSNENNDSD